MRVNESSTTVYAITEDEWARLRLAVAEINDCYMSEFDGSIDKKFGREIGRLISKFPPDDYEYSYSGKKQALTCRKKETGWVYREYSFSYSGGYVTLKREIWVRGDEAKASRFLKVLMRKHKECTEEVNIL